MFGLDTRTLMISNEDINVIMKIVHSIEYPDLLIKSVSQTIKDKAEEQQGGFLDMLFGELGPSLLGDLLTGEGTITAAEDTFRLDQDFYASSLFTISWNITIFSKKPQILWCSFQK